MHTTSRSVRRDVGDRARHAADALQGEVLAYRPEALEESLGARRVAKSPHTSLSFAGRMMAVLGAVVHAGSGLHEHVLDVGERVAASFGSHGWLGGLTGNQLTYRAKRDISKRLGNHIFLKLLQNKNPLNRFM